MHLRKSFSASTPRPPQPVTRNIGLYCSIAPSAQISATALIGSNSFVGSNVAIEDGVVIEAHVVVQGSEGLASAASAQARTRICAGAVLHAGSVIRPGVTVGAGSVVEAGSIVFESVPDHATVAGNPASLKSSYEAIAPGTTGETSTCPTMVSGVRLYQMPLISDLRGHLTVGEFDRTIPFPVKRYFMIFGVPSRETRGEHAHRRCIEFLTCVRGSCSVIADDGKSRHEFTLDRPNVGLLLPPMVWRVHHKYSPDASLVVFASEHYDPADYIRSYDAFIAERALHENALS